MIKKCPYCGNYYDGYNHSVTCGREECRIMRRREVNRIWWARKRKKKVKKSQLAKDAKLAKENGVSYGYYKAVLDPTAALHWNRFDAHVKERIKDYEAARTENRPAASCY